MSDASRVRQHHRTQQVHHEAVITVAAVVQALKLYVSLKWASIPLSHCILSASFAVHLAQYIHLLGSYLGRINAI